MSKQDRQLRIFEPVPRPPREPSFVALDFETADAWHQYPCALGVVRVEGGEVVERMYELIHAPRNRFNRANIAVHGIRPQDVQDADPFDAVMRRVEPLLAKARFVAAHNASFDRRVLAAACRRLDLTLPVLRWLCTRALAKRVWSTPRAGLAHVTAHLGIELDHHHALSDAEACGQIVLRACRDGHLKVVQMLAKEES